MVRVAAIDCGTNTLRLLIADVISSAKGTRLRDVHREMRIVRLGQGVDSTGRIAVEALARAQAVLIEYAAMINQADVTRIRMIATSAARDATNQSDFFAMTRAILGIDAEIISGEEEAILSFTGAVSGLDPADGPFVVTDVGGGSTEVVLGSWDGVAARIHSACSVDIGSVRLTERCLRTDPPTEAEITEATRVAAEVLSAAFNVVSVAEARTFIGVAGTITTLSAVGLELTKYDSARIHLSRMTLSEINAITNRFLGLSRAQRATIHAIHPGRVDIIGGGAMVVRELAKQMSTRAGITEMLVSEHDILDGVALSLAH